MASSPTPPRGGGGGDGGGRGSNGGGRPNPLAVAYPSPIFLLQYPLFATNVKILCEKDWKRVRAQSTLATTISALRETFHAEGILGLYRGGHLYLIHQAARDALRFVADRCISAVAGDGERAKGRAIYCWKMVTKYAIDVLCYPILLTSTRVILFRSEPEGSLQRALLWARIEGASTLWNGLASSLLSAGLEEAMEVILMMCIDRSDMASGLEAADKLLLKASGASVVSIFTAPINSLGVIQRCQSGIPGLLEHSPLQATLQSLPWKGAFYQFLMFSGILALNIKLIQWKVEVQNEDYDTREVE